MKRAEITPHLTPINTIWQWLVLWSLMCMGWLSREQLEGMLSEAHDGALLVYDKDGNGFVFMPDASTYSDPFILSLSKDEGHANERVLLALDIALMKPSCCEAPEGLSHFWDMPKRVGGVLPFRRPMPAIDDSS